VHSGAVVTPPPVGPILLVEDNDLNSDIYATLLRYRGYRVVEAATGPDAVRLARIKTPALVLLDIALPGMDGHAVARALRADDATRLIPIIALTASAMPDSREAALAAGCDDYLAKPVEPRVVLTSVEWWLREAAARDAGAPAGADAEALATPDDIASRDIEETGSSDEADAPGGLGFLGLWLGPTPDGFAGA
jgi:two-component system, cell cycle response regulator DivK